MPLHMRWTIRRKLILSISIPLVVGDLLILSWDYYRQRQNTAALMRDVMHTHARISARLLDANLRRAEETARSIASGSEPTARSSSDWVSHVITVPAAPADAVAEPIVISVTDRSGSKQEQTLEDAPNWYRTVMKTRQPRWFAPVALPGISDRDVCIYTTPSETMGLVVVVVPPERFSEVAMLEVTLSSPASATRGNEIAVASLLAGQLSDFAVVSPFGQVIRRPLAVSSFNRIANDPEQQMASLGDAFVRAATGESTVVVASGIPVPGFPDENYWAAFVPIPSTGWVFTTAVSESAVMSPVLVLLAERAALLATGMCIMLLMVYVVTVRLSAPIERLASATRRIGEGDLHTHIPISRGSDELAQLSNAFNGMVDQIQKQIEEIRAAAIAQGKIDADLRVARIIQADLLPRAFPERPDLDLHAINVPAEQVAGDFYDFFFTADDRLVVVIADVCGKGIPAAILMAVTRTAIRNFSSAGQSPLEIARRVNHMLVEESPVDMFLTLFIGEYQTTTGMLRYVNAGHPMAIHLQGTGGQFVAANTAPLLGATEAWPKDAWDEGVFTLARDESIVLYTDGLTEARNASGKTLGEEQALQIARECCGKSAGDVCSHMAQQVAHYQGAVQSDDLTILVLSRC